MLTNKLMALWVKRPELGGDRVFIWYVRGKGGLKRKVAATTAATIK
jgi:hypothetical protein